MSENLSFNVGKKRKSDELSEEEGPTFTECGVLMDEVTFLFDDENKLYVSSGLLCCASPVFRAMFTLEFKEKNSGVVEMKEKRYEDVLEFLLTLHPTVQKQITDENVFNILSLAEEYRVMRSIRVCKDVLKTKLQSEYQKVVQPSAKKFAISNSKLELDRTEAAIACFKILSTALLYGYDELQANAVETIARFGSSVYLRKDLIHHQECEQYHACKEYVKSAFSADVYWHKMKVFVENVVAKRTECRESFNELPDGIQQMILRKRVDKIDNDNPVCNTTSGSA